MAETGAGSSTCAKCLQPLGERSGSPCEQCGAVLCDTCNEEMGPIEWWSGPWRALCPSCHGLFSGAFEPESFPLLLYLLLGSGLIPAIAGVWLVLEHDTASTCWSLGVFYLAVALAGLLALAAGRLAATKRKPVTRLDLGAAAHTLAAGEPAVARHKPGWGHLAIAAAFFLYGGLGLVAMLTEGSASGCEVRVVSKFPLLSFAVSVFLLWGAFVEFETWRLTRKS